ncbi:unnamed protein product [Chrysodeixis includens]|uniref:Uncharacterized protein n=1 Tax=Chrysodeixis includens TaxID=689277 RepID=A0A9N8KYE6_CHRIL|nr:unnamed protein product [Chrysodeixis includens]
MSPTFAILKQKDDDNKESDFIKQLINNLNRNNVPLAILEDVIDHDEESQDLYINFFTIAFFDSCDDAIQFNYKNVNNIKYLIIISDPNSKNCGKSLQGIKEIVGEFDVTFVIQDFFNDINKIYTIFPYKDKNTCEMVHKLTHINTCVNGSLETQNVFPMKTPTNFNKCPLRIGMATLFPFSTIKDHDTLKSYDLLKETQIKGSDLEMLKVIGKHFNASLELRYVNRSEENPYVDTELLKFLFNNSLDLCAGGLYRIYGDVVAYSGIYSRQDVLWIYYGQRSERSWNNLIRKMYSSYIFLIFYFCYTIIWYLICEFDGNSVSFTNTLLYGWGALVGATSVQEPKSGKQKIINLMYLILCIYLSAFVSIQLYSYLTIQEPPQIFKTNDEVMESGRVAYLKPITKYFNRDEKYLRFADKSEDCTSFMDCMDKTIEYNGLTIVLQSHYFVMQAMTTVDDEARILRASENVLTVYNEMLIRKNSSLVGKIQKIIPRLFEGGITRKQFIEAIGLQAVAKAGIAYSNTITNSYSCQAGCTITMKQIAGAFHIWLLGCGLSCFFFVIEVLNKRKIKTI